MFNPPAPSNWGLPDDGSQYAYGLSFPRLNKDRYGTVRWAKRLFKTPDQHRWVRCFCGLAAAAVEVRFSRVSGPVCVPPAVVVVVWFWRIFMYLDRFVKRIVFRSWNG